MTGSHAKGKCRYYKVDGDKVHRIFAWEGTQPPDYQRGLGPIKNQDCRAIMSQLFKGKPKSPQQLERMRQAKLGVQKSEEHRAAMSRAHSERVKQLHAIMREHGVKWGVACEILKQQKNK